ncbi:MAG: carbohydrate-binding family 9-like protein [Pseudoflavonifractor sp.]|nr:carbohydrate-binding family 9-like protein [Alloprevotella sp.]MCM1116641.1 carbohydrate-binding family 9-like protein [Pseudoflavonifractor sp.]
MDPLHIPFIPALSDAATLADAASILDEQGQRIIIDSLNWPDQYPYHPLTVASLGHDGKEIYVDFFVRCNYLRAVNVDNNSHVHEDSCVEFFVAPEGRAPYFNFEFNCIGTIHAARRTDRHNGSNLSDEQLATVRRYASCGSRPFEELEGLFTWNLCAAIPLTLMGLQWEGKPIELMGNFYKCADKTTFPHFLSWAPIETPTPDFHRPEFFSKIILDA